MIELSNVEKVYASERGEVRALDGVSLSIEENAFVSIMGPSGCGKSTLLSLIGCLDAPTKGLYGPSGEDTAQLSANRKARLRSGWFGFVFQPFHLLPDMTVPENVVLPLLYNGTRKKQRPERALYVLAQLHIAQLAKEKPHKLSGGEQQRVAVARAMRAAPRMCAWCSSM